MRRARIAERPGRTRSRDAARCALLAVLLIACDAPAESPSTAASTRRAGGSLAAWAARGGVLDVTPAQAGQILRMSPLGETPPSPTNRVADDPSAAWLGQSLFFDGRLSADGEVSCATCHPPSGAFTQHAALGRGLGATRRNVPALFNLAWQRWYLWDGGRDSPWSQATGPLEHPDEQGTTRVRVVRLVLEDPRLRRAYEAIFGPAPGLSDDARFPLEARPDPLRPWEAHHRAWLAMDPDDRELVTRLFVNVAKTIEAYERRLVSRGAPFDRFVAALRARRQQGLSALSEAARRGVTLFVGRAGCVRCHHGPLLSDLEFHDILLPGRSGPPDDAGRLHGIRRLKTDPFNAVGPYSDDTGGQHRWKHDYLASSPGMRGAFRTPSLRNVALTAPYFHQGTHETLREVLDHYSTLRGARTPPARAERLLTPLHLTEREIGDLLAFLDSLTGAPLPERLLHAPDELPPSCLEALRDGSPH